MNTEEEFSWRGVLWGLVGVHGFRFTPTDGGNSTHLVHTEHYSGWLSWLMDYVLAGNTSKEFSRMNEELKVASEQAYKRSGVSS